MTITRTPPASLPAVPAGAGDDEATGSADPTPGVAAAGVAAAGVPASPPPGYRPPALRPPVFRPPVFQAPVLRAPAFAGPAVEDAAADPPTAELPVQRLPVRLPPVPARTGAGQSARRQRRVVALALAAGLLIGAGVAVALLLGSGPVGPAGSGTAAPAASPTDFVVTGSVEVSGPVTVHGTTCTGRGTYADVRGGEPVTVADPAGTVVATGTLAAGQAVSPSTCTFAFTVPAVPVGAAYYLVEVGQHGAVTYRGADLVRYGATLHLYR